jgi:hypothetical protein
VGTTEAEETLFFFTHTHTDRRSAPYIKKESGFECEHALAVFALLAPSSTAVCAVNCEMVMGRGMEGRPRLCGFLFASLAFLCLLCSQFLRDHSLFSASSFFFFAVTLKSLLFFSCRLCVHAGIAVRGLSF